MDPRTLELSNLRVLNDYLNQTIEALLRGSRGGFQGWGVSSPFAAQSAIAADPMLAAIQPHYGQPWAQQPWGVQLAALAGYRPYGVYPSFGGGLAHTPFGWAVSPFEIARQQIAMYARPFAPTLLV